MADLNVNNFPIQKGPAITLFGGAISASVTEANSTAVEMVGFTGGSLDVTVNSGSGQFSIAVYSSETGTEPYHLMYTGPISQSTPVLYPDIILPIVASTPNSVEISGIRSKWIKFVPTLSGTCNATFVFTPCVI